MRRWSWILILAAALATAPARAADDGPVKLRHWFVGLQGNTSVRDQYNVFNRADLPPAAIERKGGGGGFVFGRRFGDRFLLGTQLAVAEHAMADSDQKAYDIEALVTGTVLFNERATVQPFLRGGFGAGGVVLRYPADDGATTSFGTEAIAGAGLQVRLGSRFSLEFEAVGVATNFLEVHDQPDGGPDTDWRVKTSNVGWRSGLGLMFWF